MQPRISKLATRYLFAKANTVCRVPLEPLTRGVKYVLHMRIEKGSSTVLLHMRPFTMSTRSRV